ncbi:MAG: PAS domain-containing sensor histidine kinase [Treponema sp.]|nr:MAG: PAS domain-containing sensor histidine kinase [Treponema sp.]
MRNKIRSRFFVRGVLLPGQLLPIIVGTPLSVIFISEMQGENIHAAIKRATMPFHSLPFWLSILLCSIAILLWLAPLLKFYSRCAVSGDCGELDPDLVIRRLNSLHLFIITVSVAGFTAGEVFSQFAQGVTSINPLAQRFLFMNAISKGLLSGVIVSFNLDTALFLAKRTALQMNPTVQIRRTSLYRKIFLIIVTLTVYLLFQLFNTSTHFFDAGAGFLGRMGDARGIEQFFSDAEKSGIVKDAIKVFILKALGYFFFVGQLVFQIRMMITQPIRTIQSRLKQLNTQSAENIRAVDILSNDEFADALVEINTLIRRQQEELACSSSRLENIVEQAADPILSFNSSGKILVCNPAARQFFGYTEEEREQITILDLIELPPEEKRKCTDCSPMTALVDHLYGHGSGIKRFTGIHKNGTRIQFESNASVTASSGGEIYTTILRDIASQLEIEQNLTRAKIAAENANRLKTEFLANMSHELRTPLNAVLGYTQLLDSDRNLTPGQHEKISIISRSGEHLLSLINDILDISKIEAGKIELHESVFSPERFVEDLREMFTLRCQKKNLGLYIDHTGPLPAFVRGDLGKLRQVLINLIGNAVKFTREGGIAIIVGMDSGKLRFSVTDSGKGIPPEELEIIMQPFTQSSITDNEGGTGLGLAISSRYIQMMGGVLEVQSEVGKGSTFTFAVELPETDEVPGETAEEAIPVAVKKGSEVAVLIVDDKELNRMVLKEMLESAGFSTLEAVNGAESVERAREFRPRIIFMDIKMPVMDGYQAVHLLKADANTNAIPVFALTASAFVNDEQKILDSGFDGFLAKPFKKSALFRLIAEKAGVEMEYEAAPSRNAEKAPSFDDADFARAAGILGTSKIERLGEAVLINDFTAVRALADSFPAELDSLAVLIRWYADSFDEDGLGTVVGKLEKQGE